MQAEKRATEARDEGGGSTAPCRASEEAGVPLWGTKPRAGATPIWPEAHEGLEIAAGVSQRLGTHRLQRLAPLYSEAAEMVKPVGVMGVSGVGTG